MTIYRYKHYVLPNRLRSKLSKPMGDLVKGEPDVTIPVLKDQLFPHNELLVAVGDVTANLFVEHGFEPDIIVTDGQTRREALEEWKDWDGFLVLEADCPAAEITPDAWQTLVDAIEKTKTQPVHVKIHGEEDLLVLPLLIELPNGSKIVYGQPNVGAVIRTVTDESKQGAQDIIEQMDQKTV